MIARLGTALVLTLAAALPLAAEPFHHPYGEWREYHYDWLAVCPDVINEDATDFYGTSCFASTSSQELNAANLPAYQLTLLRNRLTGELDVAVTVAADNVAVDTSRPLRLSFAGDTPQAYAFGIDLETRYNTTNRYYVADPARRDTLIEQMKRRNAVTMIVPLTGGKTASKSVRLSMRGVTASLDFMSSYARRVAQY
ncbi:hypothetical protein [Devosia beringensis]|uniref:hypothetical protein n=1 Tax=Devosia beringensis TaxID=2657486 RepID=UPI00186B73B3|nr:hypothetical protein [Devosia beringensis]